MVLMVFVNDLWSLNGIPEWLEHTAADVDGMGLADWVFPGFLFIVGLSIPFAVRTRLRKGDAKLVVFRHILIRSLALWVMGLFMVNLEMASSETLLIPKPLWQILMILAFMLIWNTYSDRRWKGIPVTALQVAGVLILILLAVTYRAGTGEALHWMQRHWWGILGLIGWGYFVCATAYLLIGDSLTGIGLVVMVLFGMNALEFLPVAFRPQLGVGAATHASVIAGVWVSILLLKYQTAATGQTQRSALATMNRWTLWILALSVMLFIYGFGTRSIWGISKIHGTPSWVANCTAISLLVFLLLYWLCDRWKRVEWTALIVPAGRSTLTCYLIPYWVYAGMMLTGFHWPDSLSTGAVGILRSILFSLMIVQITRGFESLDVKVRI